MQTFDVDNLSFKIINHFQRFLKKNQINADAKLVDLGFESMDYIELSAFIFKTSGAWLDISKINGNTRISDISSQIVELEQEKQNHKKMVKFDRYQSYVYSDQLKNELSLKTTYVIVYLCLKEHIDVPKLKQAITDTLNNHFLLNCKLIRIIDDYYFESTPIQSDLIFKGSFLFPKKDHEKLIINIHSDRLVNLYLQRKKKCSYLIIAYHHIALDGWSQRIIQEEIFRRYSGLYNSKKKNANEDIPALNNIYTSSINEQSNTDELRALLDPIDPYEYGHLNHLFQGKLKITQNFFVLTKEELDNYARTNKIDGFPYSVIFAFMYHHMVSLSSGVDNLIFYMPLSNRNLPINKINELVGNCPNGLPLFLTSKNLDSKQFAAKIDHALKIYFKHMSYGAVTRILLEKNTLLNTFLSPARQPYVLVFSYLNNLSKMIYGNDSITSNYINWNESSTYSHLQHLKKINFDVHNLGSEFFVQIRSRMAKNFHHTMVHNFMKLNFPNVKL